MLKNIKNLLERSAYLIAILLTLIIIYLSLSPLDELNIKITVSDKLLHTTAYVALTLSWLFAFKKSHNNFKSKLLVVVSIFIFGIIIEILQSNLTIYRTGDYLDVIANTVGITIAMITFSTLFKWYKII